MKKSMICDSLLVFTHRCCFLCCKVVDGVVGFACYFHKPMGDEEESLAHGFVSLGICGLLTCFVSRFMLWGNFVITY